MQKTERSKKKPNESKQYTDFKERIDFAFDDFGFWLFKANYLLIGFWWFEVVLFWLKVGDYAANKNSAWQGFYYSFQQEKFFGLHETPTLQYIGLMMIFLGLSHPTMIRHIMYKFTFLNYEISKTMTDGKSLIFSFFIFLIATRMTDLIQALAFIFSNMSGAVLTLW